MILSGIQGQKERVFKLQDCESLIFIINNLNRTLNLASLPDKIKMMKLGKMKSLVISWQEIFSDCARGFIACLSAGSKNNL